MNKEKTREKHPKPCNQDKRGFSSAFPKHSTPLQDFKGAITGSIFNDHYLKFQ